MSDLYSRTTQDVDTGNHRQVHSLTHQHTRIFYKYTLVVKTFTNCSPMWFSWLFWQWSITLCLKESSKSTAWRQHLVSDKQIYLEAERPEIVYLVSFLQWMSWIRKKKKEKKKNHFSLFLFYMRFANTTSVICFNRNVKALTTIICFSPFEQMTTLVSSGDATSLKIWNPTLENNPSNSESIMCNICNHCFTW